MLVRYSFLIKGARKPQEEQLEDLINNDRHYHIWSSLRYVGTVVRVVNTVMYSHIRKQRVEDRYYRASILVIDYDDLSFRS